MPERLLILDDDEIQRNLLEAVLSVEGFEVLPATSGEEALVLLAGTAPVAGVLSDVFLPGLHGEALLTALRNALPAQAVLLGMSARPPVRAVQERCDAFLLKPFSAPAFRAGFLAAQRRRAEKTHNFTFYPGAELAAAYPVLNEGILASLQGLLPAGQLSGLYRMAIEDIGRRHERMRSAAVLGDLKTTQREAHAVKGSCGMLGAVELQHIAADIEGNTILDITLIAEIPAACYRLQRLLEHKLERL